MPLGKVEVVSKLPGREIESSHPEPLSLCWVPQTCPAPSLAVPSQLPRHKRPKSRLFSMVTWSQGGVEVSPKQVALRHEHRPAVPTSSLSIRGRCGVRGTPVCHFQGTEPTALQPQGTSRTFSPQHLKVRRLQPRTIFTNYQQEARLLFIQLAHETMDASLVKAK